MTTMVAMRVGTLVVVALALGCSVQPATGAAWGTEGQPCMSSDGSTNFYCARGFVCATNGSPTSATRLCMPRCVPSYGCNEFMDPSWHCMYQSQGSPSEITYCVQQCQDSRECPSGLSCVQGLTPGAGNICWR